MRKPINTRTANFFYFDFTFCFRLRHRINSLRRNRKRGTSILRSTHDGLVFPFVLDGFRGHCSGTANKGKKTMFFGLKRKEERILESLILMISFFFF